MALVFGEVVSQYPLAGGIYPWCRRLWGRRYAWIVAWVYLWAVIVTVTAVAEFGGGFVAALFGIEATKEVALATAVALLLLAMAFNYSGTHMLARVTQIGLGRRAHRCRRARPVPPHLPARELVLGVLRLWAPWRAATPTS